MSELRAIVLDGDEVHGTDEWIRIITDKYHAAKNSPHIAWCSAHDAQIAISGPNIRTACERALSPGGDQGLIGPCRVADAIVCVLPVAP